MENTAPAVTPELFFQSITAYQVTAIVKAAIELEVFTKIAEGNQTVEMIASACNASGRGIRILCDALTVLGFLTKNGDVYSLTEASAMFLSKTSQMYVGSAAYFLASDMVREGFDNFTEAVRTGTNATNEGGTVSMDNPVWVKFARGMMGMMFPQAQAMAEIAGFDPDREVRILDIAAGHGVFGIAMAKRYPKAQVFALDWANVLAVASEHATKFGVADRHHLIPGDAFSTDFQGTYDIVLLTNFLHHFDPETNDSLLRKVHAALNEGGRAFTLEFVPNPDRVSPPMDAMFSTVMLAGTPAGDAYTLAELGAMMTRAGFSGSTAHKMPAMGQTLVVSTR